jgi:hypothetical protein
MLPIETVFDGDLTGIHFENGRYDLINSVFTQRDNSQYISKFIPYCYEKSTPAEMDAFHAIVQKIIKELIHMCNNFF